MRGEHVKDFWDDLHELATDYPTEKALAHNSHFMGATILVGSPNATNIEILDGQQRIATSAIFIRSAINRLREIDTAHTREVADWAEERYLASRDPIRNTREPHLKLGSYDELFFHRLIIEPTEAAPKVEKPSHRKIAAAAKLFDSRLAETSANELSHLLTVLTGHFFFLYLIFPDDGEASEIFQVLNDRGIGLSTEELVHGYLLQTVKNDRDAQSKIVNAWDNIFDVIAERRGAGFFVIIGFRRMEILRLGRLVEPSVRISRQPSRQNRGQFALRPTCSRRRKRIQIFSMRDFTITKSICVFTLFFNLRLARRCLRFFPP